jgi:hypothetical protein
VWTIVPEGEPRGQFLVRRFWQTTSLERVLNQGFKFMEVENPSLLSHWPTLFLERVVRQVAQRVDALGFLDLWVTGNTNV